MNPALISSQCTVVAKYNFGDRFISVFVFYACVNRIRFNVIFLGVILDEPLPWKCQIQNVAIKVSKSVGITVDSR